MQWIYIVGTQNFRLKSFKAAQSKQERSQIVLSDFLNVSSHLWGIGFAPGRLSAEFKRLNASNIIKDDLKDCIYSEHNAVKSVSASEQYTWPPAL